jgi:hypothetical protein
MCKSFKDMNDGVEEAEADGGDPIEAAVDAAA